MPSLCLSRSFVPGVITFCLAMGSSVGFPPGCYRLALPWARRLFSPRGATLLLWHWLERWLCPREVTFCSGIGSSGGFAPGGQAFAVALARWVLLSTGVGFLLLD